MIFRKPRAEFWRLLILTLFIGSAAGVISAVATWSSLLEYKMSLIVIGPISTIGIREDQESRIENIRQRFEEKTIPVIADLFLIDNREPGRYLPQDTIGQAIILTADGWLISHESVFDPSNLNNLRVGVGPFVLRAERIVSDNETGTLFIKVNSSNLRSAEFGASAGLQSGSELFVLRDSLKLRSVNIDDPREVQTRFISSDVLNSKIILTEDLEKEFAGGPLVNQKGEIVGVLIVDESDRVQSAIPIEHIGPLFNKLLRGEELTRPALGVNGINLVGAWSAGGGRERGFLIANDNKNRRGVARQSPAESAGLRNGDILLKLRNEALNTNLEISEMLLKFNPGEIIDAELLREDQTITLPITLGEREVGREY